MKRGGALLVVAWLLIVAAHKNSADSACPSDSVYIDPAALTEYVGAMWGSAPGQTFVANDTLISSISVWRRRVQPHYDGPMKLWITEVDPTGRPLADQVVAEGPAIIVANGDGIHDVEVRFVLDPPAVLPRRGKFAFFVQNPCFGLFSLLLTNGSTYASGELWRSETSNTRGCTLWGISDHWNELDLCSSIVFCSDRTTPVHGRSWGSIKVLYR